MHRGPGIKCSHDLQIVNLRARSSSSVASNPEAMAPMVACTMFIDMLAHPSLSQFRSDTSFRIASHFAGWAGHGTSGGSGQFGQWSIMV